MKVLIYGHRGWIGEQFVKIMDSNETCYVKGNARVDTEQDLINEILEMYKEIVEPTFQWQKFSQEEQRAILAADRSNNYLDTRRLEELFPRIDDINTAVRKCLENYKLSLNIV